METIGRFIVEHPKRILGLTALITIAAVVSLFQIQFNADVASFLTEGNERGEAFAALEEKYETADPVNIVVSLPDGATFADRDQLVALAEYRDDLLAFDGVATVASIVPETSPLDGTPITPELLALAPAPLLQSAIQGPLSDLLLSEDAQNTLIMVVPSEDGIALAGALPDVAGPEGAELTITGNPAVYAAVVGILSFFLLLIPPMVLILLVGTFYANVGNRRLSVLAVVPALLGSVWTFGFITLSGRPIDIVTVIVPIFVLVMGSADGLHFVTHYQDVTQEEADPIKRMTSTLREVGVPMILTTVSTAVGFLSLLATDIGPIRQLGLFAAVGITFAGIISFFTLPAIMSRLTIDPAADRPLLGHRVTNLLGRAVANRIPAMVLFALVITFGAVFIPQLEVDSDPLFMFPDDHEVRVAFEKTEELFGGATPLVGEFAFDPSDPQASLARAAAASDEIEALPGVRAVFSLVDIAALMPPESAAAALSGEVDLPVGDMVSEDGLRFMLLPSEFTGDDLQGWLDFTDESEDVRIITGLPVLWDEMARLVLSAQIWSVVVALALVAIMLFATYRNLRQTFVAIVPLVLTIVALLGFIAASGIQLNLITAIASSIVIGVGIDYAIHFVASLNHAREASEEGYVIRAINRSGRPIVTNAFGIAIAMTALLFSPLRPHHHISGIMWVSMLVAASSALIIIPALLPKTK